MTADCYKGSVTPHVPTDFTRGMVSALYSAGINQDQIAKRLNISDETLRKYYRKELDENFQDLKAEMAQTLVAQAKSGNIKALIFWLQTRGQWYLSQPPKDQQADTAQVLTDAIQARDNAKL